MIVTRHMQNNPELTARNHFVQIDHVVCSRLIIFASLNPGTNLKTRQQFKKLSFTRLNVNRPAGRLPDTPTEHHGSD